MDNNETVIANISDNQPNTDSEGILVSGQLNKPEQPQILDAATSPTPGSTNTPAVISSANVSLNETNFTLNTTGKLSITDVDSPAIFVAQTNVAGANGTFNINTTGSWSYVAKSAFNSLNVGQSVSDTFIVQSADGTASSVTVTINGTNDAAVLSTARAFLIEANVPLSTGGKLNITDVDNPATFVAQENVAGTNGVFNIATNGAWTYVTNSALNNLNVGQNVSDQFTVTSSDGTVTTVQVTINGTNDFAVLSSATATLTETDSVLSTSGVLTITDVDGPALFVAQNNVIGTNGTFTLTTNGEWTYTAKSAFNNLNVGQSVSDTFTVRGIDGAVSTVKVTINGTNDAAIVSSESVTYAEADAPLTISGALTVSDVDNPAVFIPQGSIEGSYGVFDFGLDGTWIYTANRTFDELGIGQSISDQFNVASADGTVSTVRVTINGTNDAAVLSSATVVLEETNAVLSTSGALTILDVDSAETFVAQSNVAGTHGIFNIDADGVWTYVANSAFDNLNIGQSITDQFDVASDDGTVTTVRVTINGTNDAAVLSSANVTLAETNAPLTASGTLLISDVDNSATFEAQTNVAGTNGVFNIDTNGAWTYVANSAFNNLNAGQSISDTFTVKSVDGTASAVKVTINGTNDAPITQVDIARVVEGSVLRNATSVLANDGDVDGSVFVSRFAQDINGSGTIANGTNTITTALGGVVQMNANGTYTYSVPALNHSGFLTRTDSFFYKAGDGATESAWTKVSIVVADTFPVAYEDLGRVGPGGDISGNVITGAGGNADGADKIGVDVTRVSSVTYNGTTYSNFVGGNLTINADHGTLVINQNGSYRYQSTEKLTSAGADNTIASWNNSGIQVLGYSMGTPVFSSSTTTPAIRSNYGLYIDSSGSGDENNQLDSNTATKTETLLLNMGSDHSSLKATFRDIQRDDQIGWKTYDSDRNIVDSGIINNSVNGSGNRQEATFTIHSDAPFRYIAFYGTDTNDDFTLWGVSHGVKVVDSDVFSYTILDVDNDISTTNLTIVHEQPSLAGIVDQAQTLIGTSGADVLTGSNIADIIDAKGGNDTLFGGLGADTLIGGTGSDLMTGGGGKDTFVWKNGDGSGYPTDRITDFTNGSGGDVLNLADILTGESQTAQSLDAYLDISYNKSTKATTIEVNADGAGNDVTQKIVLSGVDLTAGGTLSSDQDILTSMINNGNLKTDA